MAASVTDQVGIGNNSASTTLETGTLTPTGSNKVLYVLVGTGASSPGDPTAVKYASTGGSGGESLTLLDSVRVVGTFVKTSVWKLVGPSASSGTIHATFAASNDERWIIAVAVQDADGTENTIAYATASSSTAPTVNATSVSGDLVLGFLSVLDGSGGNPQLTAGQTSVYELESSTAGTGGIGNFESAGIEQDTASGTSTTISWTLSDLSDWGLHAFAVNGATGGGATTDQEGFQWYNDDGNEAGATSAAAQDTNLTAPLSVNRILRAIVDATGDPTSGSYTLRYQKNGSGGYTEVPVGSSISEVYGTVTFGAIGTGANGSTTVAPSYPTGITAGQYLTCHVSSGATNSETPSTPSGWTLLATGASTDGSFGVDTGPRRMTVFGKEADGTETGTLSVSITNGNTCRGTIARWTKSGAGAWVVTGQGANDSTSGTGFSATTSSMNWNTGDATIVAVGQRVDTATQSAQSLTASGVTFGTRTNRANTAVTTGNDHRHMVDTFAEVTGTSNVDAAPTWAYTASASVSGGLVIVRLREYTAPVTNEFFISTSSNIAGGGVATTARLTAPSGKSGDFTAGLLQDDANAATVDIASDFYTEVAWSLQGQSPAIDTDYFDLRVYKDGAALDTYTVTPRWTFGSAAASLTVGTGSYALTGQSAVLSRGSALAVGAGAYTLTGNDVTLTVGGAAASLTVGTGAYSLTGQSVSFGRTYDLTVGTGAYTLSGQAVTLTKVAPGDKTALRFPSNGDSPSAFVAMYQAGADLANIVPTTTFKRVNYRQQAGYYTDFFYGPESFTGGVDYFGAHPYPEPPPSATDHKHEISINGNDYRTDDNAYDTTVSYGRWYRQAVTAQNVGSDHVVKYYYDLDAGIDRVISITITGANLANGTNPKFVIGDAWWNQQGERQSGLIRGIQQYTEVLSTTHIQAISQLETDAAVLSYASNNSITSLHASLVNPTAADITDQSGNGNDFVWADTGNTASTIVLDWLTVGTGAYVLTGQNVNFTLPIGLVVGTGAYTLTGQTVNLSRGVALSVGTGSYALSGQAVVLRESRVLSVGTGAYTLSGQAVTLSQGHALAAGTGAYTLTGNAVTLTAPSPTDTLVVGAGNYTLTGNAVSLLNAHDLVVGTGTYTLTGQSVALTEQRMLTAGTGAYSLTGQSVNLAHASVMSVGLGVYVLAGQDVTLTHTLANTLIAGMGAYVLTGQDVTLTATLLSQAGHGLSLIHI